MHLIPSDIADHLFSFSVLVSFCHLSEIDKGHKSDCSLSPIRKISTSISSVCKGTHSIVYKLYLVIVYIIRYKLFINIIITAVCSLSNPQDIPQVSPEFAHTLFYINILYININLYKLDINRIALPRKYLLSLQRHTYSI